MTKGNLALIYDIVACVLYNPLKNDYFNTRTLTLSLTDEVKGEKREATTKKSPLLKKLKNIFTKYAHRPEARRRRAGGHDWKGVFTGGAFIRPARSGRLHKCPNQGKSHLHNPFYRRGVPNEYSSHRG